MTVILAALGGFAVGAVVGASRVQTLRYRDAVRLRRAHEDAANVLDLAARRVRASRTVRDREHAASIVVVVQQALRHDRLTEPRP